MESEHALVELLRTRFDEVAEQAGRLRQEAAEKLTRIDLHVEDIRVDLNKVIERLDNTDGRCERCDRRVDELAASIDLMTARFAPIEETIGRLGFRADQTERDRDSADEHADETKDRLDDTADELQNLVVERISSLGKSLSDIDAKFDRNLAEANDEARFASLTTERRMTSIDHAIEDLGRRLQRLEIPTDED